MKATIRVSRSGLTQCPKCSQHIVLAEKLEETECPFCDVSLVEGLSSGDSSGLKTLGRRGLFAASVLGISALMISCAPIQALYGAPADSIVQQDGGGTDSGARDGGVEMKVEQAPDHQPVPKYGLPPDR